METVLNSLTETQDIRNTRYEEYEELLIKKDQLLRECGSYMTAYTREFGDMIAANFELKLECIKQKKTINCCRRKLNRGLVVDTNCVRSEIEQEMKLYYVQLEELVDEAKRAKEAGIIGEYRLNRAKSIYRRLVKLLHPDINKKTSENERLSELWIRIADAYQISDADALDDLEVLVRRALDDLGDNSFELNLYDIEARIERAEHQINEILSTEPYIYRELLADDEKKRALKARLQTEHDDYERYLKSLTKSLSDILCKGGMKPIWQMN